METMNSAYCAAALGPSSADARACVRSQVCAHALVALEARRVARRARSTGHPGPAPAGVIHREIKMPAPLGRPTGLLRKKICACGDESEQAEQQLQLHAQNQSRSFVHFFFLRRLIVQQDPFNDPV